MNVAELTDDELRAMLPIEDVADTMVRPDELRWALEPVDPLQDYLPSDASLADLLVATLRHLRAKNEILSVALSVLHDRNRDLLVARRRIGALIGELRVARGLA